MLNVEMPRDTTPKEALVAIQDRIQRDKTAREAKQGITPPRHSSRLGSASTSSSPAQKEASPNVKKRLLLRNRNSKSFLIARIARVREKKYEKPKNQ